MIHITCTNCQAKLEIDDAFAGGVCRCQHCGTIQTVPAHFKGNASAAASTSAAATAGATTQPRAPQQQKSLYQNEKRPQRQQSMTGRQGGTGLDELSEAVVSSGLARSGLRKGERPKQIGQTDPNAPAVAGVDYATPELRQNSPTRWIVLGGIGAVLLLVLVLAGFFFAGSSAVPTPAPITVKGGSGPAGGTVTATPEDEAIVVPKTPHFCGADLTSATSVVYVLDRGSASSETLDTLKAATYRSLESLGPKTQFAVVFWEAGNEPPVAYPDKGLVDASSGNVAAAEKAFEDVVPQGRSDPLTALSNAAARSPSDVIFVTAKADDVADEVVDQVNQSFPGKRVHAFAIGEDSSGALKSIAGKHNGTYQLLTKRRLDAYSRTQ